MSYINYVREFSEWKKVMSNWVFRYKPTTGAVADKKAATEGGRDKIGLRERSPGIQADTAKQQGEKEEETHPRQQ